MTYYDTATIVAIDMTATFTHTIGSVLWSETGAKASAQNKTLLPSL